MAGALSSSAHLVILCFERDHAPNVRHDQIERAFPVSENLRGQDIQEIHARRVVAYLWMDHIVLYHLYLSV